MLTIGVNDPDWQRVISEIGQGSDTCLTNGQDAVEELAIALLTASDLDEVFAESAAMLNRLLPAGFTTRIYLASDAGAHAGAAAHDAAIACIPLSSGGQRLGAILIDCATADRVLPDEPEAMPSLVRIISAAIASRQRTRNEQARRMQEASQLHFDAVSVLSHEMRTPLAAIKGYVSALLLDNVDWDQAQRREFLETIEEEADHLTALVTDILQSAELESGELRLDVTEVQISEIARRVIGKLGIQTEIHRFVLSFPPAFPCVEADEGQIEQVLTNLVDNAIKYSPDGGLIVIRGEVRPNEVVVSVIDQGIGIAPEDLNKLFERFFRATPNRRNRISGTGLGLPIADSIIRAHGGRIWAESTIQEGTTLAFALPIRRGDQAEIVSHQ